MVRVFYSKKKKKTLVFVLNSRRNALKLGPPPLFLEQSFWFHIGAGSLYETRIFSPILRSNSFYYGIFSQYIYQVRFSSWFNPWNDFIIQVESFPLSYFNTKDLVLEGYCRILGSSLIQGLRTLGPLLHPNLMIRSESLQRQFGLTQTQVVRLPKWSQ